MNGNNKRRNKGPEHIGDVLRDAKKEWQKANTENITSSERFNAFSKAVPGYLQIMFIYIDGDPQYIRMVNLN